MDMLVMSEEILVTVVLHLKHHGYGLISPCERSSTILLFSSLVKGKMSISYGIWVFEWRLLCPIGQKDFTPWRTKFCKPCGTMRQIAFAICKVHFFSLLRHGNVGWYKSIVLLTSLTNSTLWCRWRGRQWRPRYGTLQGKKGTGPLPVLIIEEQLVPSLSMT